MKYRFSILLFVVLFSVNCSHHQKPAINVPSLKKTTAPETPGTRVTEKNAKQTESHQPTTTHRTTNTFKITEPPSSQEIKIQRTKDQIKAEQLYNKAYDFYKHGQYDIAEKVLTQALHLFPFQPQVNLLLGKIYLLKGYAQKDPSIVDTARLMFQMAKALNPNLKEAQLLLDLFKKPAPKLTK